MLSALTAPGQPDREREAGAGIAPEGFGGKRGVQDARAPYRDVGRRFGPRTDGCAGIGPRRVAAPRFRPPAGDGPAIPLADD